MERYFKKNMKFIVASLVFAVISIISYFINLFNTDFEFYWSYNNMLLVSAVFLAVMIVIDAIFIIRKKVLGRGLTLLFEAIMIIMMVFNVFYVFEYASYGCLDSAFLAILPILNLVIMFYWIQSFSYSDSVIKSKKDNDICYYLIIGLVLIAIVYWGISFIFTNLELGDSLTSQQVAYLISGAIYLVMGGIAYIFFGKAIENYQDELILEADKKKEVRVEAGKKAAKTRKVNEGKVPAPKKTSRKKVTTKKTSKK